jgi:biopolymer transport protein ExbD
MKLTRTWQPNWALFGVVPFVNVVFLVLIFFALSSRYVIQPGVAITMPVSPFKLAPQRNPQIVSITSAPNPIIYFHDEKVTTEEFGVRLAGVKTKERTLIVKADRGTPYEVVTEVMNRALKLGFSVVLAGNDAAQ